MARGGVWGLEGNFERAFVRLFGAFGQPDTPHRWVTEKSFQLSNQIFAICPLSDPTPSSWVVVTIHKMCSFAIRTHQYVIPIAQWAFCNARGNTSPTNQLHSPVRVVPDPFLLKVRGTTEVVWHCRGNCRF